MKVFKLGIMSGVVGAVFLSLLAVGAGAAGGPRCAVRVTGPQTRPDNTLLSKASFHCVVAYRGAQARVAVQKRVNGHWVTVGQTRTTIDIAPGRSYTERASVPCEASSTFTGVKIRTFFALRTSSGRVVLPSQADPALCTFQPAS